MAGSLFADDAVTAADATAVASVDAAAAAVAVAPVAVAPAAGTDTDTGTGIGIGTAATGTGTDIGDWVDVFGAVLPGPAVPYRWDDMYHQKPGLAVCLYVVFNHSFRHSHRHIIRGGRRGAESTNSLPLVLLLCVWTHRMFLYGFLSELLFLSEVYSSRADWQPRLASRGRSGAQKKKRERKKYGNKRFGTTGETELGTLTLAEKKKNLKKR